MIFFESAKSFCSYRRSPLPQWGFDGWNNLNLVTEELLDPSRNLPRAVLFGTTFVLAAYLFALLGYYALMPLDQIVDFNKGKSKEGFATEFGRTSMGDVGAIILPLCIAISTFGAANGSSFSGGRLVAVSAKNGDFPKLFTIVSSKENPAPARAILMQSALAAALLASGSFEALLAGFSVAAWLFYLMAVSCLLTLRWKEPTRKRPFRVWLAVPIVFSLIAVGLVCANVASTGCIRLLTP